jgi:hypothetical protein
MVTLDDSHGIMSFNGDNFDFCANSGCILVEFLANEVLAGVYGDLVGGTQIGVYPAGLECVPGVFCTNIL